MHRICHELRRQLHGRVTRCNLCLMPVETMLQINEFN
jgi:hypothetical protein